MKERHCTVANKVKSKRICREGNTTRSMTHGIVDNKEPVLINVIKSTIL